MAQNPKGGEIARSGVRAYGLQLEPSSEPAYVGPGARLAGGGDYLRAGSPGRHRGAGAGRWLGQRGRIR